MQLSESCIETAEADCFKILTDKNPGFALFTLSHEAVHYRLKMTNRNVYPAMILSFGTTSRAPARVTSVQLSRRLLQVLFSAFQLRLSIRFLSQLSVRRQQGPLLLSSQDPSQRERL